MLDIDLPVREFLDVAPDAMVVVDRSGRMVLINRQTESLFGYTREELLGLSVDMLVPARFRADRYRGLRGSPYCPSPVDWATFA